MIKIKILLIFLQILLVLTLRAQNLDGTYTSDNQKIKISGTHIEYELISWGCCMHTIYKGTGTVNINSSRMFIKPDSLQPPIWSSIEKIESSKSDTLIIKNVNNEPFGRFVVSFFIKNKLFYTFMADNLGIAQIPKNKINNCDSILINYIGTKPVGLKMVNLSNFDYNVKFVEDKEEDFHYEFITNNGKGFETKILSDKICLKYPKRMKSHKQKQILKWHCFEKND